jgi:hypothetical protein
MYKKLPRTFTFLVLTIVLVTACCPVIITPGPVPTPPVPTPPPMVVPSPTPVIVTATETATTVPSATYTTTPTSTLTPTPTSTKTPTATATPQTIIHIWLQSSNNKGAVVIDGIILNGTGPLFFTWGDGSESSKSAFPASHTYQKSGNYRVVVCTLNCLAATGIYIDVVHKPSLYP